MDGIHNYVGFVIAGIVLNLTPGADTLYIVTRSIAQGRRAGILSALGISCGTVVHTVMAALGLSALLTQFPALYEAVRYAGVGYLAYLGLQMLLRRSTPFVEVEGETADVGAARVFWQGALTNILNPKVALFFLSFLPQFVDAERAAGPVPFLILGATFLTTGTLWCLIVAWSASRLTRALRRNARIGALMQKISGVVFLGMGAKLLASK